MYTSQLLNGPLVSTRTRALATGQAGYGGWRLGMDLGAGAVLKGRREIDIGHRLDVLTYDGRGAPV